jgi:hypothetical protein
MQVMSAVREVAPLHSMYPTGARSDVCKIAAAVALGQPATIEGYDAAFAAFKDKALTMCDNVRPPALIYY